MRPITNYLSGIILFSGGSGPQWERVVGSGGRFVVHPDSLAERLNVMQCSPFLPRTRRLHRLVCKNLWEQVITSWRIWLIPSTDEPMIGTSTHLFLSLQHSSIVMSTGDETYPGHSYSLPQLLYATKRKLQHPVFRER